MTRKDESTDLHTRVDCVHTHDEHAQVDVAHTPHTGGMEFVQPSAQLALKVDFSAAKHDVKVKVSALVGLEGVKHCFLPVWLRLSDLFLCVQLMFEK